MLNPSQILIETPLEVNNIGNTHELMKALPLVAKENRTVAREQSLMASEL
jgi:hypothetical protein